MPVWKICWIIAGAALLMAGGALGYAFYERAFQQDILANGGRVDGVVTAHDFRRSSKRAKWYLEVDYKVGGVLHHKEFRVASRYLRPYWPGTAITVYYDKAKPQRAMIDPALAHQPLQDVFMVGWIALGVSVVGVVAGFFFRSAPVEHYV